MKWIYRIFTLGILGAAIGIPFFIDNKQGEPMLSLPSVKDVLPSKEFLDNPSPSTFAGDRTVYKWKDAQGGWHYGDTPPPEALQVEAITVNANTNLIKSIPTEKETAPKPESNNPDSPSYHPPNDEDLISFERAKNILNETKDVAAMMEARNKQLGQLVGEQAKQ